MAKLIKRKVRASSLVEVLVAMVIIMIIFGLSLGVFTKVTTSGFSVQEARVYKQMESILHQAKEERDWTDQVTTVENIRYTKVSEPYEKYSELIVITVKAEKEDVIVGELKEIVSKESNGK